MIMSRTEGFMEDGVFLFRKTYRYKDPEDMDEFASLLHHLEGSGTVEYQEDQVVVSFVPDW
jgi:hypothetical protein